MQLTWFEFFARVIPEAFFVILAIHAFSKQSIDKKRFIISSLLYAILVFIIRSLPIIFGIHTILSLLALIVINSYINKINVTNSIRSGIITVLVLYVSDLFCMFVVQYLLHLDTEKMFSDVYIKTLYSLPSLILLIVISVLSYYFLVIKKREKSV